MGLVVVDKRELDVLEDIIYNISYKLFYDCRYTPINKRKSIYYDEFDTTIKIVRKLYRTNHSTRETQEFINSVRDRASRTASFDAETTRRVNHE